MPEDQGVNGDAWNDEASRLLKQFGLQQVGDSNMDIENSKGELVGIDRIFICDDTRAFSATKQGMLVEAKCYKTTSFKTGLLQEWVETLNRKLASVRDSDAFHKTFKKFKSCVLRTGVIVIWFSDIENYEVSRLEQAKLSLRAPASRKDGPNRIYVLDNYDILRLASLANTVEEYNLKNKTTIKYYYPTRERYRNSTQRSTTLSLDYMFSKFILAEAIISRIENRLVFYFGELSIDAFETLKNALLHFQFLDVEKPLTIFVYPRMQGFRKIQPEVEKIFKDIEPKVKFPQMVILGDIPPFMKNDE